jgi:hypothetical protein
MRSPPHLWSAVASEARHRFYVGDSDSISESAVPNPFNLFNYLTHLTLGVSLRSSASLR